MVTAARPSAGWLLALLALSLLFVTAFDSALSGKRYPYAADSASYVEMAATIAAGGPPQVTPWDFSEGTADRIAQRLFPPGYPLLVAAFIPLAGDAAHAALWPGRIVAVLLPLLIALLFAGSLPARTLLLVAAYALVTSGVRGWQYMAYSDVPALGLAVVALGALARGLGLAGSTRRPWVWCVLAGLAAGAAYAVRNAGLAVLAIVAVALVESGWRRRTWRETAAVVGGAALPLAWLWRYNLATFGQWQPYTMPPSTRVWWRNVLDWAGATLTDAGVPWQWAEHVPKVVTLVGLVMAFAFIGLEFFRRGQPPQRRALLLLLGGYAAGGALLLIASRSRYEWGNTIDERNTLQYTWALAFAVVLAAQGDWLTYGRAGLRWAGRLLLLTALLTAVTEAASIATGPTEWWQMLAADEHVLAAARTPPDTFLVSDEAVLFRIGAGAAVRNFEIGGDDRQLWRALARIRLEAGARPARLLLVCDRYTTGYSLCGGPTVEGVTVPACQVVRLAPPKVLDCPVPSDPDGHE